MDGSVQFYKSTTQDIFRNLALESALMRYPTECPISVFLVWQSRRAVVIGKNQNPWVEVQLDRLMEQGCPLARRISGGGAVYHDMGNLNISWIVDRSIYRRDLFFEVFRSVLKRLGFDAERKGEAAIFVNGRKVSGHAYAFSRSRVLHHATLLVAADLSSLVRLLQGGRGDFETTAVRSVSAAVGNLSDWIPNLTASEVSPYFEEELKRSFHAQEIDPFSVFRDLSAICNHEEGRLSSWEWIFGRTPPFHFRWAAERNGWQATGEFEVRDGVFRNSLLCLQAKGGQSIVCRVEGVRFCENELRDFLATRLPRDVGQAAFWANKIVRQQQ